MLADYYNSDFSVMRPSATQDDGGAVTDSTAESSTGSGYIEPLNAGERVENEKRGIFASYRLFCPTDTDVVATDEILISGTTYKVVSVMTYSLGDDVHKEVYLDI